MLDVDMDAMTTTLVALVPWHFEEHVHRMTPSVALFAMFAIWRLRFDDDDYGDYDNDSDIDSDDDDRDKDADRCDGTDDDGE